MGNLLPTGTSDSAEDEPGLLRNLKKRDPAITGAKGKIVKAPTNAVKAVPNDWAFIEVRGRIVRLWESTRRKGRRCLLNSWTGLLIGDKGGALLLGCIPCHTP